MAEGIEIGGRWNLRNFLQQLLEQRTGKEVVGLGQHAGELRVVLLDLAHRRIDLARRCSRPRAGSAGSRTAPRGADRGRPRRGRRRDRRPGCRDGTTAGLFQLGPPSGESDFGKAQEDEAEDGPEYSWDLSPELARNWSAASQRRFSSASDAMSFSLGAIQRIQQAPRPDGRWFRAIMAESEAMCAVGRGVVTGKLPGT